MSPYRTGSHARMLTATLSLLIGLWCCTVSAQPPIQQPNSGGPVTSVQPARSFEGTATKPPEYFLEFERRLNAVLTAHGVDPESHTFHFVILFNCTDPQSGGYDRMRDIVFGLLRDYLVEADGVSDHVSFVPYQLKVREDKVVWDQSFSRTAAENLYKQIPDTPVDPPGFRGGRDMGTAILEARDTAKENGELNQTVYLVLTDGKYYGSPIEPANYRLVDRDPELKKDGIVKEADQQHTWTITNRDGSTGQVSAFYRIYCPETLKPLGDLPAPGRSERVTQPWQTASTNASSGGTTRQVHSTESKANTKPPYTKSAETDYTPLIVVGVVVVCLLGLGGYLFWITRPRTVQIGVNSLRSASVVFRKPLYLGTSEDEQNNMLKLDSLPDDVPAKEKLARLEVTPLGSLVVNSQRWTVTGAPVNVPTGERKKFQLSRTSSAGLLGSADSVEVTIIKNR